MRNGIWIILALFVVVAVSFCSEVYSQAGKPPVEESTEYTEPTKPTYKTYDSGEVLTMPVELCLRIQLAQCEKKLLLCEYESKVHLAMVSDIGIAASDIYEERWVIRPDTYMVEWKADTRYFIPMSPILTQISDIYVCNCEINVCEMEEDVHLWMVSKECRISYEKLDRWIIDYDKYTITCKD